MKDIKFSYPECLLQLVESGIWPTSEREVNIQNIEPIVSTAVLQKFIPDEDTLVLYPFPFQSIQECIDLGDEFWDLPEVADSMTNIDTKKVLIIGDFGVGTDSVLALDFSNQIDQPSVIRFKWCETNPIKNNKWLAVSDTIDRFLKNIQLLGK